MVGGTGIEPVTPTMSKQCPPRKPAGTLGSSWAMTRKKVGTLGERIASFRQVSAKPEPATLLELAGLSDIPLIPSDEEAIRGWLLDALNTSVFWRARSEPHEFEEMVAYAMRGCLSVTVDGISPEVVEHFKDHPFAPHRYHGESAEHRYAKYAAACWIRSLGGFPSDEHHRYGGRLDVFCEEHGIAVECGSLAVSRLEAMLLDTAINRVIVVPLGDDMSRLWEGKPYWLPFLEFKLVNGWKTIREAFEAERWESAVRITEVLEYEDLPPAKDPSP